MPTPLPDQNSWDQFWANDYRKNDEKISWSKRRIEKIILSHCGTEQELVIDAGCGSGYFSRLFCRYGWDVLALDYSSQALAVTHQLTEGKVRTLQADLVNDNLAQKIQGRQASLIFSDGLLEHFEPYNQSLILKNIHSALKESGFIVTVVPNFWSPWQVIRPLLMPGIQEKPFILSDLKHLHEQSQFEIVAAGGINVLPFRISPEFLGPWFGMLLYVIAKKG